MQHLGEGGRAWTATVTAGPDARASSASDGPAAPPEREALLARMAASTRELVETLPGLPRHRGPLLAPPPLRRRRPGHPPHRARPGRRFRLGHGQ
ncbi:hypothetical protein ACIA5C_46350 [Actinoplanes sp. NPDC051343]|uniref:hypothetical protein n=1 Tax=Actinoplanes sp. NPDC051343 TaxID=3363906 RepID=UPI0037AE0CED